MPGGSSSSCETPSLAQDLARRIAALWRLKLWLFAVVGVAFGLPYFLLGNFPFLPVHDLPITWIDRAIGFHPVAWVWIYQSFYILVNVVPWLAVRRDELWAYIKGFTIASLVSFAVFIVYPVRSPRGPTPHPTGMHRLLLAYDAPLNALPSLHAGLLVYTLAFGWRILRGRVPAWLGIVALTWGGLILYATLATKEHYAADIISGAVLAMVADAIVWRRRLGGRVAVGLHAQAHDM
jgi:membrane-associated phospholipid phosphatase